MVVVALVRYLPAYNALEQGRTDVLGAEGILRSAGLDPTSDQLAAATTMLEAAKQDFGQRSSVIDDGWIAGALAHLPWVDRQVAAVRALRHAGEDGTSLALDLIPVLQDLHGGSGGGGSGVIKELASLGDTEHTAIHRALADLGFAGRCRGGDPERLALWADRASAHRCPGRPSIASTARSGPGSPSCRRCPASSGAGTHRYLILLTNPGEERGGGGFIGAVGVVVFQNGQLLSSNFMPSGFSDTLVTNIPAPAPIAEITGTNLVLADSDWSPNFPTSAALGGRVLHPRHRAAGRRRDQRGPDRALVRAPGGRQRSGAPVSAGGRARPIRSSSSTTSSTAPVPGTLARRTWRPLATRWSRAALETPRSKWVALATALERGAAEKHIVLDFNDPQLETLVVNAGHRRRAAPETQLATRCSSPIQTCPGPRAISSSPGTTRSVRQSTRTATCRTG